MGILIIIDRINVQIYMKRKCGNRCRPAANNNQVEYPRTRSGQEEIIEKTILLILSTNKLRDSGSRRAIERSLAH